MRRIALSLSLALLSLGLLAPTAQAVRLGGGKSIGMKRQAPAAPAAPVAAPTPAAAPIVPATPAAAAVTTPPPRRSWMGPLAGVAAGLGLAALMSHFGLGAEMASLVTIALFGLAAVFVARLVLRRLRPQGAGGAAGADSLPRFAGAGGAFDRRDPEFAPVVAPPPVPVATPPGFDLPAFERAAREIFVRMQAANDAGDLVALKQLSTAEMFAAFQFDLQDRAGPPQTTDVVRLEAGLVEAVEEAGRQVVSVRYQGLIREEADAPPFAFDEIWHLVRPTDGDRAWVIAGIEPHPVAGLADVRAGE